MDKSVDMIKRTLACIEVLQQIIKNCWDAPFDEGGCSADCAKHEDHEEWSELMQAIALATAMHHKLRLNAFEKLSRHEDVVETTSRVCEWCVEEAEKFGRTFSVLSKDIRSCGADSEINDILRVYSQCWVEQGYDMDKAMVYHNNTVKFLRETSIACQTMLEKATCEYQSEDHNIQCPSHLSIDHWSWFVRSYLLQQFTHNIFTVVFGRVMDKEPHFSCECCDQKFRAVGQDAAMDLVEEVTEFGVFERLVFKILENIKM